MTVLMLPPGKTLEERVERLASEHCRSWPPAASAPSVATTAEIIGRIVGLERAVHELAREIERLESERCDPCVH